MLCPLQIASGEGRALEPTTTLYGVDLDLVQRYLPALFEKVLACFKTHSISIPGLSILLSTRVTKFRHNYGTNLPTSRLVRDLLINCK